MSRDVIRPLAAMIVALALPSCGVRNPAFQVTTGGGSDGGDREAAVASDARVGADAAKAGALDASSDALGGGLRAEYFAGESFQEPIATRLDPAVDFDWGGGPPTPDGPHDHFSVRWTGKLVPAASATYTIHTITDDGVRVWVDGRLVIDHWGHQSSVERTATLDLRAGTQHDFKMEYFEDGFTARARLFWSSPSLPRQIIPPTSLLPP